MHNRGYIFMSANGRCPLSMSAIGRFFHNEFIVVHSGLQHFVRYLEVSAIRALRYLEVLLGQVLFYLWPSFALLVVN